MQAVKEKLEDMKEMRKVKAEAKEAERAEKDLAKARVDVAHEVRLAKEAEASMDMHVAKAGRKVEKEIEKHGATQPLLSNTTGINTNSNEATNCTHINPNTTATDNTTTGAAANYRGTPPPRNNHV